MTKTMPLAKARRFLALPPEAPVRVYTRQTPEAWEVLRRTGILHCDPARALEGAFGPPDETEHPDMRRRYRRPYDWMRERMAEAIVGYSGHYPVWAWLKRPSTRAKDVVRRSDGDAVLITALVPRGRMVLSDYHHWHSPLNLSPFCGTEAEFDAWCENDKDRDPAHRAALEATWHRVLRFGNEPGEDPAWIGSDARIVVQACLDGLHLDEVISTRLEEQEFDEPDAPRRSWRRPRPGTARLRSRIVYRRNGAPRPRLPTRREEAA